MSICVAQVYDGLYLKGGHRRSNIMTISVVMAVLFAVGASSLPISTDFYRFFGLSSFFYLLSFHLVSLPSVSFTSWQRERISKPEMKVGDSREWADFFDDIR